MGQGVKLIIIAIAVIVQFETAKNSTSWLLWFAYGGLALAFAWLYPPSRFIESPPGAAALPTPTPAASIWRLARVLAVALVVCLVSLVTEWSSATRQGALAIAAWLGSFAALSAVAFGLRVSPPQRLADRSGRRECLVLLALLVGALLLRTLWLDEVPRVYFGDESRAGMWIRTAYQNGMPNLFTMGWNTWSMIGLTLQGMFGPMLGVNTVSLRLASAVFGTAAVLTTYLLARELADRRTALLAAALLAVNRTAIDFSRLGTTHAQVMVFETLAFFFLWRAINTGSAIAYVWTGICAALCLHTYNAAHAVPAFLLGWAVLACVVRPRNVIEHRRGIGFAAAAFASVTFPWFYYLSDFYRFGNNWLQFTWMARARQITPQLISAFQEGGLAGAWPLFATQAWKTWLGFTVLPANAYQLGYPGGGMLDHVTAALFVLGLVLAARLHGRGAFLLYWWGITAFTGGVLTIDPPAFVRMVGLVPVLCILAALPLRSLLDRGTHVGRGVAFAVLVLAAALADNWRTYFVEYGNSSAEETSELVHFVRRLPPAAPVYLLGADSPLHFSHDVNVEQFVFDFPGRPFEDVAEPARFLPIRRPKRDTPTYLVLATSQLGLTGYVRKLYPQAEVVDVTHKGNGRMFFRYVVLTPDDLAAPAQLPPAYGLAATYRRKDQVLLQRLDPQLNVFAVESFFARSPSLPVKAPYTVDWQGSLRIDTPGVYSFEVTAGGPFTLDLGGARRCEVTEALPESPVTCRFELPLEPGLLPIAARWEAITTAGSVRMLFQLHWIPPGGERELVPPDHFVPAEAGAG